VSQENVEIVRRLLDAFTRHAFAGSDAALVALRTLAGVASAATFVGGGLLEGAVFRGRDGAANFVESQAETWDSVAAVPVEVLDLGDTVLVEVHLSAVGRGSGVPVERVTWNVFKLRDGRAAAGTVYTSEEEALKAVGLTE